MPHSILEARRPIGREAVKHTIKRLSKLQVTIISYSLGRTLSIFCLSHRSGDGRGRSMTGATLRSRVCFLCNVLQRAGLSAFGLGARDYVIHVCALGIGCCASAKGESDGGDVTIYKRLRRGNRKGQYVGGVRVDVRPPGRRLASCFGTAGPIRGSVWKKGIQTECWDLGHRGPG